MFDGKYVKKKKVPVFPSEIRTTFKSAEPEPAQNPCELIESEEPRRSYLTEKRKQLENWERIRQKLLNTRISEMAPHTYLCSLCGKEDLNIIMCPDCGPAAHYCEDCCFKIHSIVFFHSPQRWNSSEKMYVPVLLETRMQRQDGHSCPTFYFSRIIVIDISGRKHICQVGLCKCEEIPLTLLRYNLWAATPSIPTIAFHVHFMELLSVLQLEGHLSVKAFCDALKYIKTFFISPSTDLNNDVYRAVVGDCLSEYLHHRSRLRCGIDDVEHGNLCPVCKEAPSLISMDGNFGLVHKASSGRLDFPCRTSNSFFAEENNVKEFVQQYTSKNKKEKDHHCSEFQAGNILRSKNKNAKLDVTGVFGSICKHDIPIKFLDMHHGERIAYPIYVLKNVHTRAASTFVMYDIACNLYRHIQKHKVEDLFDCELAVPVFHSFAHNMACQLEFGQRFKVNAGLTDGEGIERLWSFLRPFSKVTKEMSSYNRKDLLNEALLHYTLKEISKLGHKLYEKHKKAGHLRSTSMEALREKFPNDDINEDCIAVWKKEWLQSCTSSHKQGNELDADEMLCEGIWKLDKKRTELQKANGEEKQCLEAELVKLELSVNKLQKKATFQDMSLVTEPGLSLLEKVKKKRTKQSLAKLLQMSISREYLSFAMKKYADGQAIGVRISRQFSVLMNKMKKEVELLSMFGDGTVFDVNEFLHPDSIVYEQNVSINFSKQKIIELFTTIKKAEKEIETIERDIFSIIEYVKEKQCIIMEKIKTSKNLLMFGHSHYYSMILFDIELFFKSFFKINQLLGIESNFLCKVHQILSVPFLQQNEILDSLENSTDEVIIPEISSSVNDNEYASDADFLEQIIDENIDDIF